MPFFVVISFTYSFETKIRMIKLAFVFFGLSNNYLPLGLVKLAVKVLIKKA